MKLSGDRRFALRAITLGVAAAWGATRGNAEVDTDLLPEAGAESLRELTRRLRKAPRRRDFKTVPMILDDPSQWDDVALREVLAYRPREKQVWDNTKLDGPWLNLMRNALNTQIWSFKHPDFLVVSATHGSAHLALYDEAAWEKYQLGKLTDGKFQKNTWINDSGGGKRLNDYQDPHGPVSADDNSIPRLMRRGVVFMSCHNAIWEQAGKLMKLGINPDKMSHEALSAELTNHLIDGVILTPGAVGTIPELQKAGFHYAT